MHTCNIYKIGPCPGSNALYRGIKKVSTNFKQPVSQRQCWYLIYAIVQFSSVAQSCPTLCDPMDCSMSGLPVITNSWHLLKLTSIESVMSFNLLILCCPLLLPPLIFPTSGSCPMSQFFASSGQSMGVSASASILPMNIRTDSL